MGESPEEAHAKPSSLSEIHNLLGTEESSADGVLDSTVAQKRQAGSKSSH